MTSKSVTKRKSMSWLVFLYQFPGDPGSIRVKIWRRLQGLGAIAIKNSVYVFPKTEVNRKALADLLIELEKGGAKGAIMESRFIDGINNEDLCAQFNTARNDEYETLIDEIRKLSKQVKGNTSSDEEWRQSVNSKLVRFRRSLKEIEERDFFGARGRETARSMLSALGKEVIDYHSNISTGEINNLIPISELKGKVWVTRCGVHIDRIATAWLVLRWVDPAAIFRFTSEKSYTCNPGEVRFDMAGAEFTHMDDLCTFEVLALHVAPANKAIRNIAEIIHDIDIKDGRYERVETPGIACLIDSIIANVGDDNERINRGITLFDDLYRFFEKQIDERT